MIYNNYISLLLFLIVSVNLNSQVSINEPSPSTATVLYLEAQNLPTASFGGFLMPIVTETQQALIPVSIINNSDDGLMVFVSDFVTGKHCWDIYDGVEHVWRSINCQNKTCSNTILYEENFNSYIEDTGVTGASSVNGNYPSGVTKWTLTSFDSFGSSTPALPGTLLNANDYALVKSGELVIRDSNGIIRFESTSIDISGYTDIEISMEVRGTGNMEYDATKHSDDFNCGNTLNDYVDIEYSTDGGNNYTEAPDFSSYGNSNHTIADDIAGVVNFSTNGISGATLILRIRIQNWEDTELFYIDNIVLKCN
tara:strand:- start:21573 stop:22502 length:930 start_codon:yes stop_codon:yes gene_type:complete